MKSHANMPEESRQLLRRIVETVAWRQISMLNLVGHCMKFLSDLDAKARAVDELELNLRLLNQVRELYRELGWEDLETAVRERVEGMPIPQSRGEFGIAYHLTSVAERVAMESYLDSSCKEFAAIARSYVEVADLRPGPSRFLAFAKEPTNRPRAQEYLERWLGASLRSFGRPDTAAEQRVIELGLRDARVASLVAALIERIRPTVHSVGLRIPPLESLGLVLPAGIDVAGDPRA
ncbi:MAG: hypothetical protein WD226_03890 [Planctomycetota bacterium]